MRREAIPRIASRIDQTSGLVFLLLFGQVLHATTRIEFQVKKEGRYQNHYETVKENKEYTLQVQLGDHTVEERSEGTIRIRDFKENKIYLSRGRDGRYTASSLFSDIGFRIYEFRNRMMLREVLDASGVKENPLDHVLMEHLFSLDIDNPTQIKTKKRKRKITFLHRNKRLFQCSREGYPLNDHEMERFMLFLRYRYGLHPRILEELEKEREIPKNMSIHRYYLGVEKYSLSAVSVDSPIDESRGEATKLILPEEHRIFELCAVINRKSKDDYTRACTSFLERAVEEAEKGNYLDSMVLFLKYRLASGAEMPEEFLPFEERFNNDDDVALLNSSIDPHSKESAELALENLERLEKKLREGRSVLMILRANILAAFGKHSEAIDLFLEALTMQPMIAGAWKDLGDIYYVQYDTRHAWACWDTGRYLNGDHPLFRSIDEFEWQLRHDHPEFFLREVEENESQSL